MRRSTDAMLLALTAVAASTDAISYLGLGMVFPANMTGNTVLLGIGIAGGDYAGAGRSAVALGAFVLGAALAGAVHVGQPDARVFARGLLAELALVAAAAGWWLSAGDQPSFATEHGLIALLSAAMGVQSATVTRLDVGVSTTFITGTWTTVSSWAASLLRARRREPGPDGAQPQRHARQVLVLVVYFGAALGAGYLQRVAGAQAIVVPLGLLVCCALAHACVRR